MTLLVRIVLLSAYYLVCASETRTSLKETRPTISVNKTHFLLDQEAMHIRSGELHYFRVPAEYWRDRLRKLRAAGLNTVSTYVDWSYHEPEERQYRFSGDQNLAQFVRLAGDERLRVILKPGPYICAERDMGGLPYWLISKYPRIKLRTTDKNFIKETKIWMNKLFEHIKPLLFGQGGPVILIQIENEYESYNLNNSSYMQVIFDIYKKLVGSDSLLYAANGVTEPQMLTSSLDGALSAANFGPLEAGWVPNIFRNHPKQPQLCSEYYTGWFSVWGRYGVPNNESMFIAMLEAFMSWTRPVHFNLYMFAGGTNFEYYSGATADNKSVYSFVTTSYDYMAPVTEAGDLTALYYLIKNSIAKFYPMKFTNVTLFTPKGDYGQVVLEPCVRLLHSEGRIRLGKVYDSVTGAVLPTFEKLRQRTGLVLYEITIVKINGTLVIDRPRDIVYVYIDGILQGVIDNVNKNSKAVFIKSGVGSRLALLVENMGRINYSKILKDLKDLKGILSLVKINQKSIFGKWTITGFPLQSMHFRFCTLKTLPDLINGPVLFQKNFTISTETPLDTYLDLSGWGKGYVWINGRNLGRYWTDKGPLTTLYVPGVWLRAAPEPNILQVLELELAPETLIVEFVDSHKSLFDLRKSRK